MKVKKKKKDEFKEFRQNDKSAYKTLKIPLKTILLNRNTIQPVINNLVFEMNDLVIHTYQFIRLYVLCCYTYNKSLPELNDIFISYCIKTLGIRDNRGKKCKDTELLETLEVFYKTEYQPLLNHEKTNLKNTTFLLPYLSTQVHTSLSIFKNILFNIFYDLLIKRLMILQKINNYYFNSKRTLWN